MALEKQTGGRHAGPELFPLAVDGDPKRVRWIMYGADGEYHIGLFNGKSFIPETQNKIPMHHPGGLGRIYAAQTFNNMGEGFGSQPRRIQVAWQGDSHGQISMATELTLRTTSLGLRVCMLPVKEIANLYTRSVKLDDMKLSPEDANPLAGLQGGLYDIDLVADLSRAKQLVLDVRGQKIVIDGADDGLSFGELKLPDTKKLMLRVVVDNTSIDIHFGEHGLYHLPGIIHTLSKKTLSIEVKGGDATFTKLQVHELQSIWKKQ